MLFMRVHKNDIDKNGEPIPGAFKNRPKKTDGMSTDWNKYATAEDCRQRARTPLDNGVIQFRVEDVHKIPGQTIEHTPIYQPDADTPNVNRSHTDVFGKKDTEVRLRYLQIYAFAIRREEPS